MICARHIFRCFKWLERMGDRFTGAAGPYFVGLAIILQTIGAASFCMWFYSLSVPISSNSQTLVTVIQPNLPLPWLTTPPCILIALNLLTHYYYVCTVSPGFVLEEVSQPRDSLLWASRSQTSPSSGVRWSGRGMILFEAGTSKCRKCGVMRPEVSVPDQEVVVWKADIYFTERAHHCRICGRCVMKYDHHCPVNP